jgi:O-antigen ligase
MTREAVDTWLERTILVLVLAAIGFAIAAFGAVRPQDFLVVTWLVLGAACVWLVRIWLAPRFRFLFPPLCWAAIPFVGYAVWRWHTSDVEFIAQVEVTQVIVAALLLLVIVNNLYSQSSMRVLALSLVFAGMLAAMYGAYRWLTGSDLVWGLGRPLEYHGRGSGPYICPNHLAGLLEMTLPLGFALLFSGRAGALLRIFISYAVLMTLTGVAASQSRAGWISAAVATLLVAAFLLRTRKQAWSALAIVLVVGGVGYLFYERSIAPRFKHTYVAGHEKDIRLRLWPAAIQVWKTNPWVGVGPNHFDERYRAFREAVDKTQARPGRAHNDYLNTLTDYGIIGLALALLPLVVAGWTVVRSWPHLQRSGGDLSSEKKSNRAAFVLGAAGGLVALLVHSVFDFNMHIPANALVAVALLSIIAVHMRFATERYWFTARWPVALTASAALAAVFFFLVPQIVTRSREVDLLRRAEPLPDGSPEKLALLKKAAAIQPRNGATAFALGEQLRALAFTGGADYQTQTTNAIAWFERAAALNKWDPNSRLRIGMCLDWLGKHDEAAPYFRQGLELDPNFWLPRAMMGWHLFQVENYAEARAWMRKSIDVNFSDNPMAYTYWELCEKILSQPNRKPFP